MSPAPKRYASAVPPPRPPPAPLYAPSSFTPVASSAGTWGRGEWGRGAGPAGGGRSRVPVSGTRSPLPAPGVGSCLGLSSSLSHQCRGDHRSRTGTPPSLALGTRVSTSLFPSRGRRAEHCGSTPVVSVCFLTGPPGPPAFSPAAEVEETPEGSRRRWSPGHVLGEARPTTLQRAEASGGYAKSTLWPGKRSPSGGGRGAWDPDRAPGDPPYGRERAVPLLRA